MSVVKNNQPLLALNDICKDSDNYTSVSVLVWPARERTARSGKAADTARLQEKYGKFMPQTIQITPEAAVRNGQTRKSSVYVPKEHAKAIADAIIECSEVEDPAVAAALAAEPELESDDLFDDDDLFADDAAAITADFLLIHSNPEEQYAVKGTAGYTFIEWSVKGQGTVAQREAMSKFRKCLVIATDPEDSRAARAREVALDLAKTAGIRAMFLRDGSKKPRAIDVDDIKANVTVV